MNKDNANNPKQINPQQPDLGQTDLEQTALQDSWATLLSETAQRTPVDSAVVLEALKAERDRTADGSPWARYLSSAVQLHSTDFDAVQPTLRALKLERRRVRQWRGTVTRWIATTAAVAAVVAAVAVFSPPLSADPTDAYSAYQEAAKGW